MPTEAARRACAALFAVAFLATVACSDDGGTDPGGVATLLDVSVNLPSGESCDIGGTSREFTAILGRQVTVTATAPSNRNIQVTVYDTDYTTQLGSAESNQGTARIVATAQVGGKHFVVACERDGMPATVRIVVTQTVL